MPEPTSPFDEVPDDAHAHPALAERQRRPWWRWNILTLFGVLFLFVWVRYFLSLSPGATWTVVISLMLVWGCGPLLLVSSRLTSMPLPPVSDAAPDNQRAANYHHHRRWKNGLLGVFSAFGFLTLAFSILHLAVLLVLVVAEMGSGGFGPFGRGMGIGWLSMVTFFAQPFLEMLASAALIVLCEIAFRLDSTDRARPRA